jgi:ElaB/YqjD/DUF883 family membrane-anchored ribosome-binding protein
MAADEIAAGVPANLDAELEESQRSAKRLLETLARKVGAARAAIETRSARQMAADLERAAVRRPVYALAAALGAGFVLGCLLKSSLRALE